jgi:copper(I)-binding protein
MIKKILVAFMALTFSSLTLAASLASQTVQISNAYVRGMPSGSQTTAVFMDLQNTDKVRHRLIAGFTTVAQQVQLHRTVTFDQNGKPIVGMRQIAYINLPAGKTVSLHPGAYHVMLIGLFPAFFNNETVSVTLLFDDGSYTTISVPVKKG